MRWASDIIFFKKAKLMCASAFGLTLKENSMAIAQSMADRCGPNRTFVMKLSATVLLIQN
jgi:hypothetical protein